MDTSGCAGHLSLSCGTVSYYTCQESCDCSTGEWTAYGKGAETRAYCNPDTCETTFQYRCAAGYYGYATGGGMIGNINCTQCPEYGNVRGTSPTGSSFITACYIPNGTVFADEYGTGVFTGDCHHENDDVVGPVPLL